MTKAVAKDKTKIKTEAVAKNRGYKYDREADKEFLLNLLKMLS